MRSDATCSACALVLLDLHGLGCAGAPVLPAMCCRATCCACFLVHLALREVAPSDLHVPRTVCLHDTARDFTGRTPSQCFRGEWGGGVL